MSAKYYAFNRVNPTITDYERLVSHCREISAYLVYRTIREDEKVRLLGYIVFWNSVDDVSHIERVFPNFNITPLVGSIGQIEFNVGVLNGLRNDESFVSTWRSLLNDNKKSDDLCEGLGNLRVVD